MKPKLSKKHTPKRSPSSKRKRKEPGTLRIIVAGSRTFNDYKLLCKVLDRYTFNLTSFKIVSGTAAGADTLGERYCRERLNAYYRIYPKWDKHGKAAGPIRNEEMAKFADCAILFWDGKSVGTKDMISRCVKHGLPHKVVRY